MMFEPIRGGTRGGAAEFKWSDVGADKDREHYLGHSINAPTGRWQKNKDVHWYNRDLKDGEEERREELRKIKEAEADALAVALGFAPGPKTDGDTPASGSNDVPIENPRKAMEKAEKKRIKEEKRARKEMKRIAKAKKRADDDSDDEEYSRRRRTRSRSRSPRRSRRSPSQERRRDYGDRGASVRDYGEAERERERAHQRREWERSVSRRDGGSSYR
ncbi:kinase phosphorylation protein-domain-containing protein [Flagelloscypha sp. PMI_526]|nr:kinase phosphorylation protein-domain-containing protein [Flagelloscypha sp. PMI_526]